VSALAVIQTVLKTELMEAISRNEIDCWVRKTASYIEQLETRLQIDTLNPNRREHIVQQAAKIAELEKERDSSNLVIAKFAKCIIDYDDIDQYSHQAVHHWEELKWFADDISNKAESLKVQG
jgi:uncharacterized coiled-coil DUF342 family protein